jgi:hypothetical protein
MGERRKEMERELFFLVCIGILFSSIMDIPIL